MAPGGSVTTWIGKFRAGDEEAAQKLWERYFGRLVRLSRKKLAGRPRRALDEEDIALSAFASFCQAAKRGRFPRLRDRDDLWQLLVLLAARKAVDHIQHEHRKKRGGGQVRGESALTDHQASDGKWGIEQVIGDDPTPEFAALVTEEYERLLERLDTEMLRTIAQLRLEGYTNQEIGERLGCSLRTVERKLWVIRSKWSHGGADHG